jgi:hypothetical protein
MTHTHTGVQRVMGAGDRVDEGLGSRRFRNSSRLMISATWLMADGFSDGGSMSVEADERNIRFNG